MMQNKTKWLIATSISFILLIICTALTTLCALAMLWDGMFLLMFPTMIIGFITTIQLESYRCPYQNCGGRFI
jgi:hypothetical protein